MLNERVDVNVNGDNCSSLRAWAFSSVLSCQMSIDMGFLVGCLYGVDTKTLQRRLCNSAPLARIHATLSVRKMCDFTEFIILFREFSYEDGFVGARQRGPTLSALPVGGSSCGRIRAMSKHTTPRSIREPPSIL